MKLIAEQLRYLRERRKQLLGKGEEYRKYCQTRESAGMDSFGGPHYLDFQEEMNMTSSRRELREIESILSKAEIVTDRNFEFIDIGTRFTVDFGDGEEEDKEETILVDKSTPISSGEIYVSTESDLGKAVIGKKAGDEISYTVTATGRKITAKISAIETMKEKYEHFIKETAYTDRVSQPVAAEIKRLKETDEEAYQERHTLTPSQVALLEEELEKIPNRSKDPKHVSQKGHIAKLLRDCKVSPIPTGEEVQIGSIVEYMIQDGENAPVTYKKEMINRAVSTEIDSQYVERISPIGNALFGRKANETFTVRRNHKPALKGVVVSVENFNEKERVR